MNESPHFRLLIIEDDETFQNQMKRVLKNKKFEDVEVFFVVSYEEALQQSQEGLFQIVSVDQKIPKEREGKTDDEAGLQLQIELQKFHPFSFGFIYTSYKVDLSYQVKSKRYFYFQKDKEDIINWREKIEECKQQYQRSIFNTAKECLPPSLAKKSAMIENETNGQNKISHVIDLWEMGLRLMTMQTFAFQVYLYNQIKDWPQAPFPSERLGNGVMEKFLKSYFEQWKEEKWGKEYLDKEPLLFRQMEEWFRFIGKNGGRFTNSCEVLRNMRNELAHDYSKHPNQIEDKLKEINSSLLTYVETLSFWARNPLTCDLRGHSSISQLGFQGKTLKGDGMAQSEIWNYPQPLDTKLLYQWTYCGEDEWKPVSMEPFLKWRWNNDTENYDLFTLYNPVNYEYRNHLNKKPNYQIASSTDKENIDRYFTKKR